MPLGPKWYTAPHSRYGQFQQKKFCSIGSLVFRWIMRAFSGHLIPEQLLFLWDLILAYDSMEVLPLLAASIISFRKDNLMLVDNLQSFEAVLADLSSLLVVPLLQLALEKPTNPRLLK